MCLTGKRRRAKPGSTSSSDSPPTIEMPSPESPQLSGKFSGLIAAVEQEIGIQYSKELSKDEQYIRANSLDPKTTLPMKWLTKNGSRAINQAQLHIIIAAFEHLASKDYMLGSPRIDQLLTLIQFNVLRALISNTYALGWTLEWLECAEPLSPWNTPKANQTIISECPEALRPTALQLQIPHHPWIDLWPLSQMRDNLLLANLSPSTSFNEDQLCNDLVEFTDFPNEQTGLIVWSDPWDPRGWEISGRFARKWGWTLKGCEEFIEVTNWWRARRGERELAISELED